MNLTGVFLASQAIGKRMVARRRGAIVNVASIAGQIGLAGTVAYSASKGGVVMLTRALAVEWAPHGVRVNAIAPSWFSTPLGDLIHREPEYESRAMRRVPLGRMGRPEELVGAAIYLASDASAMVTGPHPGRGWRHPGLLIAAAAPPIQGPPRDRGNSP